MKGKKIGLIVIMLICLMGCQSGVEKKSEEKIEDFGEKLENFEKETIEPSGKSEIFGEDFLVSLTSMQSYYHAENLDEEACFLLQLVYIGEEPEITVFHSRPLGCIGINTEEGKTVIDSIWESMEVKTVLKKGEPYLVKMNGEELSLHLEAMKLSQIEDEGYDLSVIENGKLKAGNYQVTGNIEFALDENAVECAEYKVILDFQVREKDLESARQQLYQDYIYEMTYDRTICYPLYINSGNSEMNHGEVWQFMGYDNEEIYINTVKQGEPYVQMGVPVLITLDNPHQGYGGIHVDYYDKGDEKEALYTFGEYMRWMLENGSNKIVEIQTEREELVLTLKDGVKAKIRLVKNENQYEGVFCQFTKNDEELNEIIQKMYDSFVPRNNGNILLSEEEPDAIASAVKMEYESWDKKGKAEEIFCDDYQLEYLFYDAINEISRKEYTKQMKRMKEKNLDTTAADCTLNYKNGEVRHIELYFAEDYMPSYMKYNGRYYAIPGGSSLRL